jgi:hypothetical protein
MGESGVAPPLRELARTGKLNFMWRKTFDAFAPGGVLSPIRALQP